METGVWIALGLLALVVLASSGKPKKGAGTKQNDKRIDHLHYHKSRFLHIPYTG